MISSINPGVGKGANKSKADGLSIGGLKGFWLPEYLKFAGLFQAALPRTVSGVKDRKTYILHPNRLSWKTHQSVMKLFEKTFYNASSVKMDIFAMLYYCIAYLAQWKQGQSTGMFRFVSGNPGDHVSSLEVISYKDMGSAYAAINISSLVLPAWLEVQSVEDADRFADMLDEHRNIIYQFNEKKGDEYDLLKLYRKFLSSRTLRPLFQFTRSFSGWILSKMNAKEYIHQFTVSNLEVLIMSNQEGKKLSPILQNDGFRNIATAIRLSTVVPQYQKSRGVNPLYKIRYGLGKDLMRHAQYPDDFIQELSRFIFDYNHENAQKNETQKKQFRRNITVQDMETVTALIDEYGAETVASLLVAFGFARDPKVSEDEDK